ncbi:hypothetical protein PCE1_001421 [Barthelona sp. PCE]
MSAKNNLKELNNSLAQTLRDNQALFRSVLDEKQFLIEKLTKDNEELTNRNEMMLKMHFEELDANIRRVDQLNVDLQRKNEEISLYKLEKRQWEEKKNHLQQNVTELTRQLSEANSREDRAVELVETRGFVTLRSRETTQWIIFDITATKTKLS